MSPCFDRALPLVLLTTVVVACNGANDDSVGGLDATDVGGANASVGGRMGVATSLVGKGGRAPSTTSVQGGDATSGGQSSETRASGRSSSTSGAASSATESSRGGATEGSSGTGGSSARRTNSSSTNATTGGASSSGGSGKAGAGSTSKSGGASAGGSNTGGTSSTRSSKVGTRGSGSATGGNSSRGGATSVGGAATGGANVGGSSNTVTPGSGGSSGPCTPEYGQVPSNVSAWVDESWNSELGQNIKSRQAWLLDSVMKGKGQINLCVRWGATSAPTAAVKSGMAAAVEKWFNDWFSQLKDYACFPYSKITTKVTGWAVKSGNTAWVSDLGSDVKIYTETDAEGEPKCPDNCSFFTNWSHSFPKCEGGEAFHHDYWLWLDNSIGGGAAAVGGDWGLRMPVSNFIASMGKSDFVIEHEMGHGFGFQDYYSWNGSKPSGGSLMIVGSTNNSTPTTGDTWLLRRAWKESKAMRGW